MEGHVENEGEEIEKDGNVVLEMLCTYYLITFIDYGELHCLLLMRCCCFSRVVAMAVDSVLGLCLCHYSK